MATPAQLINAICTPLESDGSLHTEGLAAHLEANWNSGIRGILVAGSMGLMQLLRDTTYRALVRESARLSQGRGEILIGIGDAGYHRTRERLDIVLEETREYPVQGVVAVTPYFSRLNKKDLITYYHQIADDSPLPTFLYYLPGVTGVTIDLDTALAISKHPNVHGIKASCDIAWAQQLKEQVRPDFRIIVAQPHLAALLPRIGFTENLDGIFSVVPQLTKRLVDAAAAGDWACADQAQALFSRLLQLIVSDYGVFPACEALLNEQGVKGDLVVGPLGKLSDVDRTRLLNEPTIREILSL